LQVCPYQPFGREQTVAVADLPLDQDKRSVLIERPG
jgi:hypothetical protein